MAQETFSCLVTPPQVYISSDSENLNAVTLTASMTNTSGEDMLVKAVQVIVPIGTGGDMLTPEQAGISTTATATNGDTWIMTPMGPGRYKAMPAGGMATLEHGDSVVVSLYNVEIEATPGTSSIGFILKTNAGTQEYSATVNKVEGSLKIDSFTADPSTIDAGGSAELSWATTNASRISISPGDFGNLDTSGQVTVTPHESTVYTLNAWGSGPVQSKQVEVQVAKVAIVEFSADDYAPIVGKEVTLSWKTEFAEEVVLMPGNIPLEKNGSFTVNTLEPTIYTLIARGNGPEQVSQIGIQVTQVTILDFAADEYKPAAGQDVTLRWTTVLADEVTLMPGDISLDTSGTCVVNPTEPTEYRLIARSDTGQQAVHSFFVRVQPVTLDSFTYEILDEDVDEGVEVLLQWDVSNESGLLLQWVPSGMAPQNWFPEIGSRTFKHNPTTSGVYLLSAEGYGGIEADVKIELPIEISDFEGSFEASLIGVMFDYGITKLKMSAFVPGAVSAKLEYSGEADDCDWSVTFNVQDGMVEYEKTWDANDSPMRIFVDELVDTKEKFTLTAIDVFGQEIDASTDFKLGG